MVPGVSAELCGGTHVRHTGDIGLFRIVSESGVAAGIRRIEAVTGSAAYRRVVQRDELLEQAAAAVKTTPDALLRRIEQMQEESRELRRQLERAREAGSGDVVNDLIGSAAAVDGAKVIAREVEVADANELRAVGDRLRERLQSGAAVIAGRAPDRVALIAVVTDDLIRRGVRADALVREIAKRTGGSGGGRPHMAQGGVGDASLVAEALSGTVALVIGLLGGDK
jgi:alanyl-tRNA synthetase